MAEFLEGTKLSARLEEMIRNADEYIWLISPYIKLHERIRKELCRLKDVQKVQLVVVFGKNENDAGKSLSIDDLDFLKSLPNIFIGYEKNLHAKFYATEDGSLISSMNLHQYSQNTNIEAGIYFKTTNVLNMVANKLTERDDTGEAANDYFENHVIKTCEVIFNKEPQFEAGMFGLNKKYIGSSIQVDTTSNFFNKAPFNANTPKQQENSKNAKTANNFNSSKQQQYCQPQKGYCIRTGVEIPFDPTRPYSYKAYQSWSFHNNPDFAESFCHKTGRPSNGQTSMRNPIFQARW